MQASNRTDYATFEKQCVQYRSILKSVVESRMDPKLLQRIDPSDVVQETLLEAYLRLEDFNRRRPMPLSSWLRETAIQQLKLAVRRHQRAGKRSVNREISVHQSSVFQLAEGMTAIIATAQDRHQSTEDAQRVWAALGRLRPADREVLMMRYLNGLSNIEVAEILGLSEAVASKRHCRALIRLQGLINSSPNCHPAS